MPVDASGKTSCPRCDGVGTYPYSRFYPESGDPTPCECWRCNGTGKRDPAFDSAAEELQVRLLMKEQQARTIMRVAIECIERARAEHA